MSVDKSDIEKIAILARIRIDDKDIPQVLSSINDILTMVDKMQAVDTSNIEPMANPLDATARLRSDSVTETDRREDLQSIAPNAEDGLYLVPKVID